jgi:ABC-type bacteriocin/lantibiotic exporter with double-glycine peptidase domain
MSGDFTIGMIVTFQGLLSSFMGPAQTLLEAGQTIQEMRVDMERVGDVMEAPDDPTLQYGSECTDKNYTQLSGEVELKHVTFGYSPLDSPTVTDFSMHVKPGSWVAIVGASGCGKSTVSKLITGLYQPWEGEILFDGKPIEQIPRNIFTSSVSMVDQDIVLFEDTIANNIRMWDNTVEDAEMVSAAQDAQIHEEILQRPGGYQGKLTENGKDLSGGQRQRIEIARVLAQDPSVIIMDEATSALDAKTEHEVVKAIHNRGITCIVVAHRLSTIRDCDEIIVLDKGKIVERGVHEELYAKGGIYAELVTSE